MGLPRAQTGSELFYSVVDMLHKGRKEEEQVSWHGHWDKSEPLPFRFNCNDTPEFPSH